MQYKAFLALAVASAGFCRAQTPAAQLSDALYSQGSAFVRIVGEFDAFEVEESEMEAVRLILKAFALGM